MALSRPTYATREQLARATDTRATARMDAELDAALEAGADSIDGGTARIGGLLQRRFYPWTGTRYFDWPAPQTSRSWVLRLNQHELISASSVVAGGVTVSSSDYFLRPDDGPPYSRLEIDLDSSAALASAGTHQRAIGITGLWSSSSDTAPAGALAEALDGSETGVDVTDSSAVGVGNVLLVESERMLVTGKTMLDTGVDIDTGDSLTVAKNDVSITVSSTVGAPVAGETILIDSERMLVVDVAGAVLTVQRAADGSLLAAHAAGSSIYAPRTLTVTRGALGTTAAAHSSSTAVSRHIYPGLVRQLNLAEAIAYGQQNGAGWARTAGSGDSARDITPVGLPGLREQAYQAFGRRARHRAV